jgi:hypothetical protein
VLSNREICPVRFGDDAGLELRQRQQSSLAFIRRARDLHAVEQTSRSAGNLLGDLNCIAGAAGINDDADLVLGALRENIALTESAYKMLSCALLVVATLNKISRCTCWRSSACRS